MAGMKKTGMNKMRGMKGGQGTKAKTKPNKKVMKKRMGQETMKKGRGKKTEMEIHNFKDMMFKKFGGGKT
jgi:hypothetical protein